MSGEEYLLTLLSKKSSSKYAEDTCIESRACPFVKYYKDKLTVKYTGKGLLYNDFTVTLSFSARKKN